jgi:hypothetical protein
VGEKNSTHVDWALEKAVKFSKEKIEKRDIWIANILPFCKKGERVQSYLEKIQTALHNFQKRLLNKACQAFLSFQEVSW